MEKKKQFYKTMIYILAVLMILVIIFSAVTAIIGINDIKQKRANQAEPQPYKIEEYYEDMPADSYTKVEIKRLDTQVTVTEHEQGSVNKKEVGAYYDFETTDGKKGVIYISEELKQEEENVRDLIFYYKYTINKPNHEFAEVPDPVTMYGLTFEKPKGEMVNGKFSAGVAGPGKSYIYGNIKPVKQTPAPVPEYDDVVNKIAPILIIGLFLFGLPLFSIIKKYKAL